MRAQMLGRDPIKIDTLTAPHCGESAEITLDFNIAKINPIRRGSTARASKSHTTAGGANGQLDEGKSTGRVATAWISTTGSATMRK